MGHQGYQVIVAPVVKQCRLDYGARGYDTNNFAVDKASCALVSGLFAAPTTHPTSQMARNAAAYLLYDSYLVASRTRPTPKSRKTAHPEFATMPFIKIQTNQRLSESDARALASQASASVAGLLGKPEAYVMVSVESNTVMQFAGNDDPLAYLELKSIGLPQSITASTSRALCDLIAKETGIAMNRIYIEFTDAPRHMWGWNGDTF